MSRLFVVILKCFKLLDMSYLPMQEVQTVLPDTSCLVLAWYVTVFPAK